MIRFPFSIHSLSASYEIQFGHVQRPTHYNTTWDLAKFEVCAQKWADLSEYGFGVALLNDCKYGYATKDNIMRLSLLRSPKQPDPTADMGSHRIRYALYPHEGTLQDGGVIRQAYEFNDPLQLIQVDQPGTFGSFISIDHPGVVIESVKLAEHNPSQVVVRLYDSFGGHFSFSVKTSFPISAASLCNILERQDQSLQVKNESEIAVAIKPFQILSLKLTFKTK